MSVLDIAWLAGLLEGEGSFLAAVPSARRSVRISLQMTDEDVVCRAAQLMGGVSVYCARRSQKNARHKDLYVVVLRGVRAAALMRVLLPLMGARRRAQIDRALATVGPGRVVLPRAKIKEELARGATVGALAEKYKVTARAIYRVKAER